MGDILVQRLKAVFLSLNLSRRSVRFSALQDRLRALFHLLHFFLYLFQHAPDLHLVDFLQAANYIDMFAHPLPNTLPILFEVSEEGVGI